MIVLGLDVATKTGWCLIEPLGQGRIRGRCGSWRCAGSASDQKAASLAIIQMDFIRELRRSGIIIGRAAIEAPIRKLPRKKATPVADSKMLFAAETEDASNAKTMMDLYALFGAAVAILSAFGVPVEVVEAATWRKAFIGVSYAPRDVGNSRQWLKQKVRERADMEGAAYGFTVPNMDASDAVGIAFWLHGQARRFEAEALFQKTLSSASSSAA